MIDYIIDFETFDNKSSAMVIDLALIAFNADPHVVETFDELVKRGKRIKFSLASQKGERTVSSGTIKWWKDQGEEAKKNLTASPNDVDVDTGIQEALDYIKSQGIDPWKSQAWCRGMSFDFPIFNSILFNREVKNGKDPREVDLFNIEPVKFWQQRDIRTAIECYALARGLTTTPLPMNTLNGFVAHDSVHDCAKDILMLKYAQRYALGLDECPDESTADPLSLPKSR